VIWFIIISGYIGNDEKWSLQRPTAEWENKNMCLWRAVAENKCENRKAIIWRKVGEKGRAKQPGSCTLPLAPVEGSFG